MAKLARKGKFSAAKPVKMAKQHLKLCKVSA